MGMEIEEEGDGWKCGLSFVFFGIVFIMSMGVFSLIYHREVSVCLDPPKPDHHGVLIFSKNVNGTILEGAIAEYKCDQGYTLVGPSTKICKKTGDWEPVDNIFCALN